MDVSDKLQEVGLLLAENRLIAVLDLVTFIERDRIAGEEPDHHGRKIVPVGSKRWT